jgi:hypothetical protein
MFDSLARVLVDFGFTALERKMGLRKSGRHCLGQATIASPIGSISD